MTIRDDTPVPCDMDCPECKRHLTFYYQVRVNAQTGKPYLQLKTSAIKTYWQPICPYCTTYLDVIIK